MKVSEDKELMIKTSLTGVKSKKSETSSLLKRLFLSILIDRGVTLDELSRRIDQWLADPKNGFDSPSSKSSTKSNIRRELKKPNMTVDVFIKMLSIMNIKNIRLSAELLDSKDVPSEHSITVEDISEYYRKHKNKQPDRPKRKFSKKTFYSGK